MADQVVGKATFVTEVDPSGVTAGMDKATRSIKDTGNAAEKALGRQTKGAADQASKAATGLGGSLKGVNDRLDRIGKSGGLAKSVLGGVGLAGGLAAYNAVSGAISGVVNVIGDAVGAASDLAEQQGKVGVVFGDSADQILAWGKTAASSIGLSERAALTAAGTFGNLFVGMGESSEAAADMSKNVVELAADVAAFNNLDTADVLEKLRSGLTGEAEPLKSLGVLLNEAGVKAQGMAMGLGDAKGVMSDSEKVQARYALIVKQTSKAQGNFRDTSKGLAGQQKILDATIEDLSAHLGGMLVGPAAAFLGFFNDLLTGSPKIETALTGVTEKIKAQTAAIKAQNEATAEQAAGVSDLDENWKHFNDSIQGISERYGTTVIQFAVAHETMAKAVGQSAEEVMAFYNAEIEAGRTAAEANADYTKYWLENFKALPDQLGAVWARLTGQTDKATGEIARYVAGRTRVATLQMLQSLDDAKEPWKAGWRQLAGWAKDPFKPSSFETWIKGRAKAATRHAREAAEDGKPGVARRWRALARAMRSPVTAQLVALGDDVQTAITKVLALQALAKQIEPHAIIVTGTWGTTQRGSGSGDTGGGGSNKNGNGGTGDHYAAGGYARGGRTIWTGENGPERVRLLTGGGAVVTPNQGSNSMPSTLRVVHEISASGAANLRAAGFDDRGVAAAMIATPDQAIRRWRR